jgi:replicative DNA helicase
MTTQLERRAGQGVAPPHNIEAEESVLGAVMLSADAANLALETLRSDDFYKPAHQTIWEAITSLFDGNEPIDPITVADWLRRNESLERVGGVGAITRLMEGVPSTSNVDYYAGIVDETSVRRRLLRAGSEVGTFALRGDIPIEQALDSAEAEVFAVAERKMGEGLEPVGPMLKEALEKIEALGDAGGSVTGTSTGFHELDQILAGLHPENLVVVAARPGMGKSTLAINMAAHIADGKKPVALFTLEMSREEVVHRLLASMAGVDSPRRSRPASSTSTGGAS